MSVTNARSITHKTDMINLFIEGNHYVPNCVFELAGRGLGKVALFMWRISFARLFNVFPARTQHIKSFTNGTVHTVQKPSRGNKSSSPQAHGYTARRLLATFVEI